MKKISDIVLEPETTGIKSGCGFALGEYVWGKRHITGGSWLSGNLSEIIKVSETEYRFLIRSSVMNREGWVSYIETTDKSRNSENFLNNIKATLPKSKGVIVCGGSSSNNHCPLDFKQSQPLSSQGIFTVSPFDTPEDLIAKGL